MTIAIDYTAPASSGSSGGTYDDFDEYEDACSILVPVDVMSSPGVLKSVTAGGVPLAEETNPAWDAGITYAADAIVYSPQTHRVYASAKDGNVGKDPTVAINRVNAAGQANWWIDIGPTNLYAMFDGLVSSQTSAASPLVIKMTPAGFNGFALFGIDADSYSVTVKDAPGGSTIYYEPDTPLDATQPSDYYEYFFERSKPLTQLIKTNIEAYTTAEITLTLTKVSGNVNLGMLAIGDLRPVGIPQRDASVEPQDFSYVVQDSFGNTTVKKRANATGMSITTKMNNTEANSVLNTIREVLGTPCVVVGSGSQTYSFMTVFGLVSARMQPNSFPLVDLSITVKGLI